jgi:hypothetical protein
MIMMMGRMMIKVMKFLTALIVGGIGVYVGETVPGVSSLQFT